MRYYYAVSLLMLLHLRAAALPLRFQRYAMPLAMLTIRCRACAPRRCLMLPPAALLPLVILRRFMPCLPRHYAALDYEAFHVADAAGLFAAR